jgi:hypothetical protein
MARHKYVALPCIGEEALDLESLLYYNLKVGSCIGVEALDLVLTLLYLRVNCLCSLETSLSYLHYTTPFHLLTYLPTHPSIYNLSTHEYNPPHPPIYPYPMSIPIDPSPSHLYLSI